jgi:hypothetical protein
MLKRRSNSLFPYIGGQLPRKEKFSKEVPDVGSLQKGSQSKEIVLDNKLSGCATQNGATSVALLLAKS